MSGVDTVSAKRYEWRKSNFLAWARTCRVDTLQRAGLDCVNLCERRLVEVVEQVLGRGGRGSWVATEGFNLVKVDAGIGVGESVELVLARGRVYRRHHGSVALMGACGTRDQSQEGDAKYSNCGSLRYKLQPPLLAPAVVDVRNVAVIEAVVIAKAVVTRDVATDGIAGGAGAAVSSNVRATSVVDATAKVADAAATSVARVAGRGIATRAPVISATCDRGTRGCLATSSSEGCAKV